MAYLLAVTGGVAAMSLLIETDIIVKMLIGPLIDLHGGASVANYFALSPIA